MNHSHADTLSIRPFVWSLWPDLWRVRLAQLVEQGVVLDPSAIPPAPLSEPDHTYEWDFHHIEQVYLQRGGNFWLAYLGEQPVGSIAAQDLAVGIELRRMYVQAAYRRRGIGAALVQTLLSHSQQHQIPSIELWTSKNGVGRRLYAACGFEVVAAPAPEFVRQLHHTRYTPGADEIRMRYTNR